MSRSITSLTTPKHRGKLRQLLCALGFGLATSVMSIHSNAACQYIIESQWHDGFSAKIKVINDSSTTINGWNINWSYTGDNRIASSYNAILGGNNPYTATHLDWNRSIAPNQFIEFGFQGTKGASAAEIPVIQGAACGNTPASSAAASSVASSKIASSVVSSTPSSQATFSSISSSTGVAPLSVQGNKVVANGQPAKLAGMSLFWSNTGWGGEKYYNAQTVAWLKSDWKVNLVRAAMGVDESGGYLSDASNKTRTTAVIDAAIANDIYVIIDWHTHHGESHKAAAINFFKEMATQYGHYPNVIYEIYNEPLNISWSGVLKPYAVEVIKEIRAIDPDNLIIVGTPNWSQDVDVAANDPITGYSNIAYTLHFYAGTHKQFLRDKAQAAMDRGIALFVTEWGTVNADGNGGVDAAETNSWLNFMKAHGISHANWALNDKAEGASALVPGASANGGWTAAQLTPSGTFVRNAIIANNNSGTSSSIPASSTPASSSRSSIAVSSVVASSTASAASSVNNGAVLFSETFETGAVNSQPTGWENFIGWVHNNSNTVSGAQYALIDNSKSYNGSNSIHFKAGAAPAQIIRALPAGTQRLYTRAYVNLSRPMGNVAGDNHEHIFGIKKTPDANDEIRVGQIKGVLGTNHVPSDNIAPKMNQWFGGTQLAANTWYCVETAYLADQAYDSLYMWVNGALVHSITSAADWNNGALPADWMSDKFNYVMFGFHSFSNNNADVWMDDIVVSTQPIGCGPIAVNSSSAASSHAVASSLASSRASSVASSVPISSATSVASSIASSSSAAISSAASSVANNAAWNLDSSASYLNFATTKNTHTLEVHNFGGLAGDISSAGVARVTIDLNTVNSGVAIRDERLRSLLFETTTYPTATITVTVPGALLNDLQVGQTSNSEITAVVDLHGMSVNVTTRVSVQRLSADRLLVQSIAPVLARAADFNLTAGVDALRSIANLTSISTSVPVDFALVFNAR